MAGPPYLEERVAALEAQMRANDAAVERDRKVYAEAINRAEQVVTKRFEAANEIREAMLDRERSFVTVAEFRWAIGAIIAALLAIGGLVVKIIGA